MPTLGRYQFTAVDETGDVLPLASVEVRLEADASLVQLYSDRNGASPIGNPFLADADGFAAFHCDGGSYKIVATLGGATRTWRYVPVGTAAERDIEDILASPAFTGTPSAPTAAPGNDTTQLASTGFVQAAITALRNGVSAAFDTLAEIATELALKATIASPTFTGTPAAPTPSPGDNTTQLATTAFVQNVAGGSVVLIRSVTPSGVATVEFINGVSGVAFDDATFDRWFITIDDLKVSADDKDIHLEIGTGGTPTWQTGAGAYKWALRFIADGEDAFTDRSASDTGIYLTNKASATYALGNAAGESLSGRIEFTNPEATNFPKFNVSVVYDAAVNEGLYCFGGGKYNTAAAFTAVRIVAESGNTFASGRVSLYGIKKA